MMNIDKHDDFSHNIEIEMNIYIYIYIYISVYEICYDYAKPKIVKKQKYVIWIKIHCFIVYIKTGDI